MFIFSVTATGKKAATLTAALSLTAPMIVPTLAANPRYHHDHKPGSGKMDLSSTMGQMDEYHSPSPSADADLEHQHDHPPHVNSFLQQEPGQEVDDEGLQGDEHHRQLHTAGDSPGQHEAALMSGQANRGNLHRDNSFLDEHDEPRTRVLGENAGSGLTAPTGTATGDQRKTAGGGLAQAISSFLSGLWAHGPESETRTRSSGFLQEKTALASQIEGGSATRRSKSNRAFVLA
mmetsp:Transcript_4898/g.12177  ORF Transcript_4898/g.12177 Transcript_4898/m.12177 type:complete len:233 (-) Transcript_4898:406-1104(-)|eukprot:g17557.t1